MLDLYHASINRQINKMPRHCSAIAATPRTDRPAGLGGAGYVPPAIVTPDLLWI